MGESFFIHKDSVVLKKEDNEELFPIKGGIVPDSFGVIYVYKRGWLQFAYLKDRKGVWWFNGAKNKVSFVTTEVDGFRVLDDDYGLDSNHLYLEDKLVPGSAPTSFELLQDSPYFARDKNFLYVKSSNHFHVFDDVDVTTLVAFNAYCTDKDHLFHHYDALSYANESKGEVVDWLRENQPELRGWWHPKYEKSADGADQVAFEWYKTEKEIFYRTEAGVKARKNLRSVYNLVRNADVATFEPLDENFSRDSRAVYYQWRMIKGADPKTFKTLGGRFGRDTSKIYYNGYCVDRADPDSFFPYLSTHYLGIAKDKDHVYRNQYTRTSLPFGHPDNILQPIKGAEAASFELLTESGSWAVDAGRVYLWGSHAKKMDRLSFEHLHEDSPQSWAKDRTGLYNANGRRTVKGIDGRSFVMLNSYWGKDNTSVFCFVTGSIQKTADAETFKVTDDVGGAEDATYQYAIVSGSVKKTKRKRG
ncbi:DKNYY domain-containing protein [Aureibacillus halotolerans]|uniref:DKNYY family protein n=1 Tax=Aureibacillus halotolerans TaxID=1508390 RepID=A0A4R6U1U8_9BACI|nr:DKNYY domain-containing protein [Aureibacillus halotolerans]TDQ40378.1 DKNYY family protein [Aureibacillus halotolerans]